MSMQAQGGARAAQNAQDAQARAEVVSEAVQAELNRAQAEIARAQAEAQAGAGGFIFQPGRGLTRQGSPTAVYEALREQREELRNQMRRLEEQRENITNEMQGENVPAAAMKGLEARLASVDARIAAVESQLAEADGAVARAAAVPGAVQPPPPPPPQSGPPDEFWVISTIFIFVVLMPIAIAYARRIWKRTVGAVSAIPQEVYERFNRLDQAIDSVAIEVERVGEGQRFLTRMYADQRGLGAGPAERVDVERAAHKQTVK
jgi:hypothetical protein